MTSFELIGTMRDDLDEQNLVNRYRNRLDDIRTWYQHLPDIMLTVSGYAMDLAGTRGTTSRIPGGDALAMLAPWAPDADHGDDLPHPAQTVHEWVEAIDGTARRTFTENWRWLRDHTPQILESQWATAWRQDIDALWHRLERLSGDAPRTEQQNRGQLDCEARAHEIPGDKRLTLTETQPFWPKVRNRVEVDRHREREQAKKEKRPPEYRCDPDEKGRYLVSDLREHYGARRDEEMLAQRMTTV